MFRINDLMLRIDEGVKGSGQQAPYSQYDVSLQTGAAM